MPIVETPHDDIEDTNTHINSDISNIPADNVLDNEEDWELYTTVRTKEDIKNIIDKSKSSEELYENAIKVLENLQSNFLYTLNDIAQEENRSDDTIDKIRRSRFDSELDTENPVTIFEKKWKELLEKARQIEKNLKMQNLASQTIWSEELQWIDDIEKDKLIEELFQTRSDAIENFKDDVADGLLSNENNIRRGRILSYGERRWEELFNRKEKDKHGFENEVNAMNLSQLVFHTFNINEWYWAFTYCYNKVKEKLWNKNLFDFIDEQNKGSDQIAEVSKYSALKMLFQRRMTADLTKMIDEYSWNKQDLIDYVEKNVKESKNFKIAFLTSINDLENSKYFWKIVKDLKDNDPDVIRAIEAASNVDNIDIFKDKKVNGLLVYDNEWDWWWAAYFDSDFRDYTQKKGFIVSSKENNKDYIKYILKKGNDTLTMVKIKNLVLDKMKSKETQNMIKTVVGQQDYNLFALRGHCYNTKKLAKWLWIENLVWEGDLLIDGGCYGANATGMYYQCWIKWQICAYTWEWRWTSTQAFIDKIINAKNSWKSFSDVLWYYNWLTSDSSRDGYFAFSTERPDYVSVQYKKITQWDIWDNFGWLTQDLPTSSNESDLEAQTDIGSWLNPEVNPETQNQPDEL